MFERGLFYKDLGKGKGMVCLGFFAQVYLHVCSFVMPLKKGIRVTEDNHKKIGLMRCQDKPIIDFLLRDK